MCLLAELLSSYGRMSVYAYELVEIHLKSLQLRPLPGQGPFETHDTWQGPDDSVPAFLSPGLEAWFPTSTSMDHSRIDFVVAGDTCKRRWSSRPLAGIIVGHLKPTPQVRSV